MQVFLKISVICVKYSITFLMWLYFSFYQNNAKIASHTFLCYYWPLVLEVAAHFHVVKGCVIKNDQHIVSGSFAYEKGESERDKVITCITQRHLVGVFWVVC